MLKSSIARNLIILVLAAFVGVINRQAWADVITPFDFILQTRPVYQEMQIDKKGKILSKREFETGCIYDIRDKLIYNTQSNFCKKNHFEAVHDYESFENGLIAVKLNKKWGYADKNCKMLIQPQFDRAFNFSEGLAVVEINKKKGYIDKTGKIVIQPQFDIAFSFQNGTAKVMNRVSKPPVRPIPLIIILTGLILWIRMTIRKAGTGK